jgi:hypothetical protein
MFAQLASVRRTLEGVAREFEPATLDGVQSTRMVRELGVIRRLVDAQVAKAGKRVDDTMAHRDSGAADAACFVADALGVGSGEARRAVETARKLEQLPATDAAVRDGRLSAEQARLIARTAHRYPDAEEELLDAASRGLIPLRDACLAAEARREDPSVRAARQHASRACRTWYSDDGMVEGWFRLTPEVGGQVKAVLDDQTRREFRNARREGRHEDFEAYTADALAHLILEHLRPGEHDASPDTAPAATETAPEGPQEDTSAPATIEPAGTTRPRSRVNVHVVIDYDTLTGGEPGPHRRCEIPGVGPVDPAWVRSLLGEAFVTAVVQRGRDITTVAHLGRHLPAELLTALTVAGRECEIGGCHHRGYLEVDHCAVDFADGGPTAWWNLAWLCYLHHKRKTQGWKLSAPHPSTSERTLVPPDT